MAERRREGHCSGLSLHRVLHVPLGPEVGREGLTVAASARGEDERAACLGAGPLPKDTLHHIITRMRPAARK